MGAGSAPHTCLAGSPRTRRPAPQAACSVAASPTPRPCSRSPPAAPSTATPSRLPKEQHYAPRPGPQPCQPRPTRGPRTAPRHPQSPRRAAGARPAPLARRARVRPTRTRAQERVGRRAGALSPRGAHGGRREARTAASMAESARRAASGDQGAAGFSRKQAYAMCRAPAACLHRTHHEVPKHKEGAGPRHRHA